MAFEEIPAWLGGWDGFELAGGVITHGRDPRHIGRPEGIHNKIEVLERMPHGYRDDASFFMKRRTAFPGIP